jgi:hypothetical protein
MEIGQARRRAFRGLRCLVQPPNQCPRVLVRESRLALVALGRRASPDGGACAEYESCRVADDAGVTCTRHALKIRVWL